MLPHAWLKSLRAWFHTPFRRPLPRTQRKSYHSRGRSAVRLSWLEPLEPREVPAVFGLGSTDSDAADSVQLDAAGNAYVCGTFGGSTPGATVDFDPGPGTFNLTNADNVADGFVAKYSPTGQLLWVGQLVNSTARGLAVDGNGNVLATGSFEGTTDFDFGPGSKTLTSGTYGAGYVAKYTADGGLVWADQLGGSGVSASAITVDGAGNVYTAGVLNNGTADMDPGPGTFNLTNSSGNANTYISKLDASGNFVWAEQFANAASAAGVWPEDIGVDADQRVYVSGLFVNQVNFDTGGGTHLVTAADGDARYGDAYVARLTAAGGLDYVVTMGSTGGRDDGYGIAVGSDGTAYVTGQYSTVTGQPAPTPLTITPATGGGASLPLSGGSDLFVMRLSPAGGLDWARSIGGPGFDGGQSIAIGPDGLYLTGYFNGTVDFDPGAGVQNATGAGGFIDDFILKLGTDSTFLGVSTFGGTDYEYPNDIAVNGAGAVGVVGRFYSSGDFDPGPGVTTLTSAGQDDGFVIQTPGPAGLSLVVAADSVSEAAGANATTATVTRAGDTSQDLTVYLTSSDTTEATVPATVTIPAGQASATFAIDAVDDSIVDGTQAVTVGASALFNAGPAVGLDPTFGSAGIASASMHMVIQPPGGALAVQADGKALIAAEDGSGAGWRVQRFNPDGTLDTTFGASGAVTTALPGGTFPVPFKIVVQDDGKILVGGKFSGGVGSAALARYNPDGTLDPTFGAPVVGTSRRTGIADLANAGGWIEDMAVRPDGRILLAIGFNGTISFRAAQLTPTGQFDGAFGVKTYNSINAQSHAVILLPDGRFILAGGQQVARFLPDGSIDTSFGVNGVRTFGFGSLGADMLDARLDPAGRIVVAGYSVSQVQNSSTNNFNDYAVARLTPDGNLDASFGGDGTVVTDLGGLDDIPAALAVQADGKVVVAGYTELSDVPLNRVAAVVRYTTDGNLDTTFDGDGVFRASLAPTTAQVLMDGALQADGKLVVLDGFGVDYRLARINMGTMILTAADTLDVLDNDVVNRAPVADNLSVQTDEDTALNGQVSATDADGNRLSYAVATGPAHGTLALAPDGSFTYTPAADYNGPDSFTFTANDGTADSDPATVGITVNPVNDAPVAAGWQFGTKEDTPLSDSLRASDVDGDVLTYSIVSQPSQGTVQITNAGTGAFTYTPPLNFNGTVSFTFKVNDGTADSNEARVFVTVNPVNDAPVAQDQSVSTDEDTPLTTGQVAATDVDGPALTYALVAGPAHGTVVLNADGSFTYRPAADYNGPDSFTFKANDGALDSNTAKVSVTVNPVNDPPVASGQDLTTDEDTDLLGTLSAIDVDGDKLSYALATGPAHGTVVVNAGGSFTYTPAANYNGPDSFTFKANDGTADSDPATVGITVNPVNDAPTLAPAGLSLPENSPNGMVVGTVTGSDLEGDPLTYSIVGGNTGGAFAIDPGTGQITVANSAALDYEKTPTFTLTVQVTDPGGLTGTATVTVNLTDVPEAPQVAIDIRPDGGSSVNVKSHGKIEVAILSTADFDARTVDVSSLRFGRTGTEDSLSMNPKQGPRFRLEDVNGDGRLDLVIEFETELTGFRAGDTAGILTGNLLDGTAFSATDSVSVKSPGK